MGLDYLDMSLGNPNIKGIVTSPKIFGNEKKDTPKCIVLLDQPDQFFYYLHNRKLHECFRATHPLPYIHPSAQISPRAIIAEHVHIGANTVIHDGAVILDNTVIGESSVIYQNVTLGTEGFFSKIVLGKKIHVQHFGGVKLGENCIVHAGSNISRSVNFDEYTHIGNNTHIGIHASIAHDCQIGDNCNLAGSAILAGRVRVGNHVWIGGGAQISNGVQIGNNSAVKVGSVVIANVNESSVVSGHFARNHHQHLRDYVTKVAHDANT